MEAARRLSLASNEIQAIIVSFQVDAFRAVTDRKAFKRLKKDTNSRIDSILETFRQDATIVGVDTELKSLIKVTKKAIDDLPFPEELDIKNENLTDKVIGAGVESILEVFGGHPSQSQNVNIRIEDELQTRLLGVSKRLSNWWEKHRSDLMSAVSKLQQAVLYSLDTR